MPTEAEIAAAKSPAQNLATEARLKRPETARDRFKARLSQEGAPPAQEGGGREQSHEAPTSTGETDEDRAVREAAESVLGGDANPAMETPETHDADGGQDGGQEAEEATGDGDEGDAGDGALTPTKLAEMAGITPDQLYAMEFRVGDDPDETFTLGELKDRMRDLSRIDELQQGAESEAIESTRNITERMQSLDSAFEEATSQAQFYSNLAEQAVRQYDQVNWDVLRSKPEEFQRMRQGLEQAVRNRDRLMQASQQLRAKAAEERRKAEDAQAQVSLRVLKRVIPDWSDEVYSRIREFAVENLQFTPEEAAEVRDWRTIRSWHRLMQVEGASRRVKEKTRRSTPTKPGNKRAAQAQSRNAQGQFQAARREAQAKPGDRDAFRRMKAAQLAAERGGR
jgi:hypothetical protein